MKRLVCILMCLSLLMSMFLTAAAEDAATVKEIPDDILAMIGPYEEEVTIHVATVKDPTLMYAAGESLENNAWQRAYKEYLNINVVYDWTATSTQYDQKLSLAMMSGDLPDIMRVDKKNLDLLVEGDMIADLSDCFFSLLTPTTYYQTVDFETQFAAATRNGKLYALPQLAEEPSSGIMIPYIRKDWLANLGLDYPKTMDEFLQVMIAFTKDDPDGNGKNDTYGLGIKKNLWKDFFCLEGFFNAYHAYPNIWIEDADGNLVYGSVLPEMKKALQALQYLYSEGAIDPEFAIKEYDKVTEDLAADKIGAAFSIPFFPTHVTGQQYLRNPEKYAGAWRSFEIPASDDKPVYAQSYNTVPKQFMVVNKNCKHPEALAKMYCLWIELMFSDNVTAEMYHKYHVNDEVGPYNYSLTNDHWPYKRPRYRQMMQISDDPDFTEADLTGEAIFVYDNIKRFHAGDIGYTLYEQHANFCCDPNCEDSAYSVRTKFIYLDEDRIMKDLGYGPQTPTQTERESTLKKLQDETVIQIITGEKSVDEWDSFVENWYNLGGKDITKEMNEWWISQK